MRRRNGESTCYLGSDGRWHGRVSVGLKPDGSPDRRHVSGYEQDTVLEKIRKLQALRDAGKAVVPARVPLGRVFKASPGLRRLPRTLAALPDRPRTPSMRTTRRLASARVRRRGLTRRSFEDTA